MSDAGAGPGAGPGRESRGSLAITRRLFATAVEHKGVLVLSILLSVVGSVLALLAPLYVQATVDLVVVGASFDAILQNVVLLVVVNFAEVLVTIASTYAMTWLGVHVTFAMRNDLFRHLQRLPFPFFQRTKTGKIISYVTNDVETVNVLVSIGLVNVIVQLFQLAGALVFMLALSIEMSILILLYTPVNMGLMIAFTVKSKRYYVDIRRAVSSVTSQAQEAIDGFRTIKAFKTEAHVMERFEHATRKELDANMAAASLWSTMPAAFTAITFTSIGSCVLLGGVLFLQGTITNIGLVFAFIMYIMMFLGPMGSIAQFASDIQNALVGAGRVLNVLDTSVDMVDGADAIHADRVAGSIQFRDVQFAYDGEAVLKGITLDMRPKERLAIVGPTGAGKTTLASLVPRFFDVDAGTVMIDGIDVRRYRMTSLRKNVGLVLQDNFLFASSIRDNIRYGRQDASDGEIEHAARLACAHEFIEQLPSGYDTVVGERGAILSIGQRQLIAFARAILADPPVLILDEATSSVDAYSEVLVQASLESLLRDRTSIIIAHRLSTVVNADRIIVLEGGRIAEEGTHQSLIARGGLYTRYYHMQFAGAGNGEHKRDVTSPKH